MSWISSAWRRHGSNHVQLRRTGVISGWWTARRKRLISHDLQVAFARPANEPMLWLPDAAAGAMSAAVLGERRWLETMGSVVTVHHVSIR